MCVVSHGILFRTNRTNRTNESVPHASWLAVYIHAICTARWNSMKAAELIEKRQPQWSELEQYVHSFQYGSRQRLTGSQMNRFAALYRAACADLAHTSMQRPRADETTQKLGKPIPTTPTAAIRLGAGTAAAPLPPYRHPWMRSSRLGHH